MDGPIFLKFLDFKYYQKSCMGKALLIQATLDLDVYNNTVPFQN